MACDSWLEKLDAYLDGELPSAEMSAFDGHVRGCPECAANALARVQMKRAVRSAGLRFTPSAEFRQRIRAKVVPAESRSRASLNWLWATAAMALLLLALGGWSYLRRSQQQAVYSELHDLHVTTLASANPVDVVSSDRHTVKPWFQGRIPFTFNLPELGNSEFALLGGRVTYLGATPGAQLIYELRKHRISVFIFPEQAARMDGGGGGLSTNLAYHTLTWTQGGLRYFVVGDASPEDIQSLAKLLQSAG
jgi:anti-sigma factor RsiW